MFRVECWSSWIFWMSKIPINRLALLVKKDIALTTWIQASGTNLMGFHNPHFFDAGEEGGGFEAEEFGSAARAVDFPVGLL